MDVSVASWIVILLAVLAANLPFFNERLFALVPVGGFASGKPLPVRLLELIIFYFIVGGIAFALESNAGNRFEQGWEFLRSDRLPVHRAVLPRFCGPLSEKETRMNARDKLDLRASENAHLAEVRQGGNLAYDGDFLKVQQDQVLLPDGKPTIREYIKHPGAVVILPVFDDGSVLMERQYRYPLDQVFIEFPAGKIDPGEESLVTAKRELLEETGYTATDWRYLCTIHNAIAYSDEHLDIFLARGLSEGKADLDDGEFLETFKAPLADLLEWVRKGKITDVKTVIGTFWLEKVLSEKW